MSIRALYALSMEAVRMLDLHSLDIAPGMRLDLSRFRMLSYVDLSFTDVTNYHLFTSGSVSSHRKNLRVLNLRCTKIADDYHKLSDVDNLFGLEKFENLVYLDISTDRKNVSPSCIDFSNLGSVNSLLWLNLGGMRGKEESYLSFY